MDSITKGEIDKVVGQIIKKYRIKENLTQEELAEKIHISQKYISRVETGVSGIGDETLIKCINVLGITPNTLFEEFITNETIKKQMSISKEINELSVRKLDFLEKFIEILKNM